MKWEITIIATIDATTIQHRIYFTITHTHRKKAKAGKRQKKISIFCYIHLRKKNGAHTTRFNFHLLKSYLSCFFHSVPLQFKTFIYTKFIYGISSVQTHLTRKFIQLPFFYMFNAILAVFNGAEILCEAI